MSANHIANNTRNQLAQSLFLFPTTQQHNFQNHFTTTTLNPWDPSKENPNPSNLATTLHHNIKPEAQTFHIPNNNNNNPSFLQHSKSMITFSPFRNLHECTQNSSNAATSAYLSATALLQKAATIGAAATTGPNAAVSVGQQQHVTQLSMDEFGTVTQLNNSVVPDHHHYINMNETRDFLGLTNGGDGCNGGNAVDVSINVKDMLTFTGSVEYQQHQPYEHHVHHHSTQFKSQQQGFGFLGTTTAPEPWGNC